MNLIERLNQEIVISDGAIGTMLQVAGLPRGSPPEIWNLTHPETIKTIHKAYIKAGAQIITTNTFGANRAKLKEFGLDKDIKAINQKAVEIAKSVANVVSTTGGDTIVAGSIGPTGKFLKPFGELRFDEAYNIFREQASYLTGEVGPQVDVIMIETMIDTLELKAAVIGARDATNIPIIAQFSFNEAVRTVTGTDAKTASAIFDALQVQIFGANCGSTLEDAAEVIKLMAEETISFLIVQPNAGIGENITSPTKFAEFAIKFVELGANIVGSCCGSTPEHTNHIANAVKGMKPICRGTLQYAPTRITSRTQTIYMEKGGQHHWHTPLLIVGERINPSGKPKLKQYMRERNIEAIKSDAIAQVEKGAKAIDINTGSFNHNLMAEIFSALQTAVQVPLFIDSQDPVTIEEALKVYAGKGVINSVNGREDLCHKLFPIAKRYGAAVIGLTIDEQGIPETPCARLEVAKKIIKLANSYGLKDADIIIDPLVLPIATHENITIETLRMIKQELGVSTILGISNISYGLPAREFINQAFLMSAILAGLDAAILDPYETRIMELISAAEVLAGRDCKAQRYISKFTTTPKEEAIHELPHPLQKAVLSGNKNEVTTHIRKLLQSNMPPLEIINELLIPAMEEAGERYEKKELFLPQLIGTSEAMKEGISIITPFLGKEERKGKKVLLATVEGDMHDLGKNLVKVILEANGYEVIDLGKDVKPAQILEVCKAESPDIVGLSCLMTTTLSALEITVEEIKQNYLRSNLPCVKIIVGGASVENEFAKKIGTYYAKDAVEAVKLLKTI